jgi:hypothetical protein
MGWLEDVAQMLLSPMFKGKQETVAAINTHNCVPQGSKFNPKSTLWAQAGGI